MKAKIKSKVKAKAAAVKAKAKSIKAKVKGKCKKCALVAKTILAAFCLAVVCGGCTTATPASRATTSDIGGVSPTVKVSLDNSSSNTIHIAISNTFGDSAIASADSAGSTETQTATPTTDVKPDIDVSVPVNKAGAAQTLGSTLGDAAASLINGIGSSSSSSSSGDCKDGSCSTGACTDGSCEYKE